jgi:phosphoribosylformimino-5-aminoimidazole carboxamide ribotide isomerase
MRVVPVIDLKQGEVVRGRAGRRSEYRPIESRLAAAAAPGVVARAFSDGLGLSEFYLADLDAIGGTAPDWDSYAQVLEAGATLWVDAGAGDSVRARELADFRAGGRMIERVVVGLESLADWQELEAMVRLLGPRRIVFSLDLKAGQPVTESAEFSNLDPEEIALGALDRGVTRLLVLDVAGVGMDQGVRGVELCRFIRLWSDDCELACGGGVRGTADLEILAEAGCDAALVASALHDGKISRDDLALLQSKSPVRSVPGTAP